MRMTDPDFCNYLKTSGMELIGVDDDIRIALQNAVQDLAKLRDILVEAWQAAFKDLAEVLERLAESVEDMAQVKPTPKFRPVKSTFRSGRVIDQRAIIYSMCPARYR